MYGKNNMKPGTKLKKNKWYWIEDPGSNMHRGYTGKAQCIDPEPNNDHLGGPTYMFMYYDKYYGFTEGAFGLEDVVYEMKNKNTH